MKIYENLWKFMKNLNKKYKIFWKLWNLIKIMKFYGKIYQVYVKYENLWKFMEIYKQKIFMTSYEHFINAIERKEKIERKMLHVEIANLTEYIHHMLGEIN